MNKNSKCTKNMRGISVRERVKKCQFNFVLKAEQVQAIHPVVTGNDDEKQQDLASLFATL